MTAGTFGNTSSRDCSGEVAGAWHKNAIAVNGAVVSTGAAIKNTVAVDSGSGLVTIAAPTENAIARNGARITSAGTVKNTVPGNGAVVIWPVTKNTVTNDSAVVGAISSAKNAITYDTDHVVCVVLKKTCRMNREGIIRSGKTTYIVKWSKVN